MGWFLTLLLLADRDRDRPRLTVSFTPVNVVRFGISALIVATAIYLSFNPMLNFLVSALGPF